MLRRILLSFIGANDAPGPSGQSDGAVMGAMQEGGYDELILFWVEVGVTEDGSSYGEIGRAIENTIREAPIKQPAVTIVKITDVDITDHTQLYKWLQRYLDDLIRQFSAENTVCTAAISSGTPAMQTAWILLAETGAAPLRLVKTLEKRHAGDGPRVIEVSLMTGVAAEMDRLSAYRRLFAERQNTSEFVIDDPTALTPSQITLAKKIQVNVLIVGETGTGKEVLARVIHDSSGVSGPFVTLNCSSRSDELIESELFGHERGAYTGAVEKKPGLVVVAKGGTLFLDEINSMPLRSQAKLLRFIETGEYRPIGAVREERSSVRIVAAGNQDLWHLVTTGDFREDLYYRLCTFELRIPPLRQRQERMKALFARFVEDEGFTGIEDAAFTELVKHPFRGNVRELRILASRLGLLHADKKILTVEMLTPVLAELGHSVPAQITIPLELAGNVVDFVHNVLAEAAVRQTGNEHQAAKLLGITHPTVKKWSKPDRSD